MLPGLGDLCLRLPHRIPNYAKEHAQKEGKPPKKRVRFLLPTTSSADSDTEASLPVRKDLPTAQVK